MINHNGVANFNYTQGFAPGTQLQVTFNNNRSSSQLRVQPFQPLCPNPRSAVQITQPLLNGFGKVANTRFIIEAKNTVKVGESQFAQQVINTVTQVSNDYWELVYARENVKVEEATVAVDQQLYENNKSSSKSARWLPLTSSPLSRSSHPTSRRSCKPKTRNCRTKQLCWWTITKDPLAISAAGVEIVPTTPIRTPDIIENIPPAGRSAGSVAEEAGTAAGDSEP